MEEIYAYLALVKERGSEEHWIGKLSDYGTVFESFAKADGELVKEYACIPQSLAFIFS